MTLKEILNKRDAQRLRRAALVALRTARVLLEEARELDPHFLADKEVKEAHTAEAGLEFDLRTEGAL